MGAEEARSGRRRVVGCMSSTMMAAAGALAGNSAANTGPALVMRTLVATDLQQQPVGLAG